VAYDALNDFQTGFDKVDLDFITGSGLVAYAEVAIGSNGFPAVLSAASGPCRRQAFRTESPRKPQAQLSCRIVQIDDAGRVKIGILPCNVLLWGDI